MTAATIAPAGCDPLSPLRETLRAMNARPGRLVLPGISPDLGADIPGDWIRATDLVSGDALPDFLDTARQRWQATPHAAAALAWKCYSYWLALPAVLGYAAARRVPLLRPEAVAVAWSTEQPFLRIALTGAEVAVLSSDPLAVGDRPGIRVVADDDALLAQLQASLVGAHLSPLLDRVRTGIHVARRTFWGSLAAGVAHGLSRAADVVPGPVLDTTDRVLTALGVRDLVDLQPHQGGLTVQRRTCCLSFTLPEPKVCAGCCIR